MPGKTHAVVIALALVLGVTIETVDTQPVAELTSVRTVSQDGTTAVIVEADGALPLPTAGSVENPPRLFFDFAGVTTKHRRVVSAPGAGLVRQTRFALNATNMTRVVIDLPQIETYRIDAKERAAGRIRIVVGTEASAPPSTPSAPAPRASVAPPSPPPSTRPAATSPPQASQPPQRPGPQPAAPPAVSSSAGGAAPKSSPPPKSAPPMSAPPATTSPPAPSPVPPPPVATPPVNGDAADSNRAASAELESGRRRPTYTPSPTAPKPPARDVERYRQRLADSIERLEAQQPILMLLDAEGAVSTEALEAAFGEFTAVRRTISEVKPSAALASAHEMLLSACTLGATASRLGVDAARDRADQIRKNAASAAAGALMLFDRACADLGCLKPLR